MRKDTNDAYLESIQKAISYIESSIAEPILLKDIAIKANLSQYHFHRVFKSLTGDTVKEFITRLRLEKAALKLKHGNEEIGMIALDTGYRHHETFARAFSHYFGMSPSDYRSTIGELTLFRRKELEKKGVDMKSLGAEGPEIRQLPELHLAYIRHNGSYDKVGASFQRLMLWAATQFALKLKPETIGIVHDNPDLTEEDKIRFDACVLTTREVHPKGEIGYKKIPAGKYAMFTYKGDYDNFYEVYDFIYNKCLFDHRFELDDRPALEWYIKSPPFYKPENYLTHFYVPIR